MASPSTAADDLEAIRRDIDRIDLEMLELFRRRFAAIETVRAIKAGNGGLTGSPLRPAREAAILRRLVEAESPHVPPSLKVRLWRAIMAEGTLAQAALHVHVSAETGNSGELGVLIAERFGRAPLRRHASESEALSGLARESGDALVTAASSGWAAAFAQGRAGRARVIGALPDVSEGALPRALILGHAPAEATGADETLIVSDGQLPRDFALAPLWQATSGGLHLTSLPGFLDEQSPALIGLIRANPGLKLQIAGRYPSPIETKAN